MVGIEEGFKIKAWKLYYKYIRYGTEFELNLSHRRRTTLDNIFGNYDRWYSQNLIR